jgi:thymidylate synthase
MVTVFKGRTVDQAWLEAFYALKEQAEQGYSAGSRDGNVVGEICDAVLCVEDPTRNIVNNRIRNMPMRYAVGELAWYLSGSNRVSDITQFAKKWSEISDDGETNNSAYGWRIFDKFGFNQWEHIKKLLRDDPSSRQAVIHIKDADNTPTKDVPCTVYLQFFIRKGRLNLSVHMRSNDIWMGVPYDMFSFCFLQMLMAMELGVKIGSYTHYAGSLHMYARDYDKAKENIEKLPKEV